MTAILRGALMILGAWTAISFLFLVACCIPRAIDNAKVRKARREMRAQVEAELERDRYDREFAEIVAHYKESA